MCRINGKQRFTKTGAVKKNPLSDVPYKTLCEPLINSSAVIVKSASLKGILYMEKIIVTVEDNLVPVFGIIESIIVDINKEIQFVVKLLRTSNFDQHVQAYRIETALSENYQLIRYHDMNNKFPTDILYSISSVPYIIYYE